MHKDLFKKFHFNLDNKLTTEIQSIDKQKDESLREHISKIKKLRYNKWKSLNGPPPSSEKQMTSPIKNSVTPDVNISRATSFYAWDDTTTPQKSIITSTKLPAEMTCTNERISFTEVTKFYEEGVEDNFNSLSRSYPQNKRDNVEEKRNKVKHIYIPHINKEGRVIRQDAFQPMLELDSISDDSLIEEEFKTTNIEEFKERMEKKIANLRVIPLVPSFPIPVTSNIRPSILNMVRKIDLKKFEFSKARSRSHSRLSQALQESEKCRPTFAKNTKIVDEVRIPLENYPGIQLDEIVTRKYFKLETNNQRQNRFREEIIFEDEREWGHNVFMTDIQQQNSVKSFSEVEV